MTVKLTTSLKRIVTSSNEPAILNQHLFLAMGLLKVILQAGISLPSFNASATDLGSISFKTASVFAFSFSKALDTTCSSAVVSSNFLLESTTFCFVQRYDDLVAGASSKAGTELIRDRAWSYFFDEPAKSSKNCGSYHSVNPASSEVGLISFLLIQCWGSLLKSYQYLKSNSALLS